jgi:hypothetical protein
MRFRKRPINDGFQYGGAMPDVEPDSLARGLVRIHLVISRGVEVARQRCRAYASGEPATPSDTAGFADYLDTLVSVLHGHHTAEDEVSFPVLRDRLPDTPWDLLADEHRAVGPLLARLGTLSARIRQHCINRFSNPNASPPRPSHRRWLWTLDSSAQTRRSQRARSGTSTAMMSSSARQ